MKFLNSSFEDEYAALDAVFASMAESAVRKSGGDAGRARASAAPKDPPYGETGGTLRHPLKNKGKNLSKEGGEEGASATNHPPPRASRKKTTSKEMQSFLDRFFIDWLTVSVPNSRDGTGRRIGTFEAVDKLTRADIEQGEYEETVARNHLFSVAAAECLRPFRVGRGTDGFHGASHLSFDPTDTTRVATIRAGHSTNMPSLELPGSSGKCAILAPKILRRLGPVNVPRVDITIDISAENLFEEIEGMIHELAVSRKMKDPTYRYSDGSGGRTVYFGSGDVSVKVYKKDFERFDNKKIAEKDIDPNLVRVEFSIHEQSAAAKAAIGRYLQERDDLKELVNRPGNLLKNYAWVREFVENLAVMTDEVDLDAAHLEVGRMKKMPVSRPAIVRAKTATRQYSRTFCNAAIVKIVDDEFDGDWQSATTTPAKITDVAIEMLKPLILSHAHELCDFHALDAVQRGEHEAQRQAAMLEEWLNYDAALKEYAEDQLHKSAEKAREAFALPEIEPSATSADADADADAADEMEDIFATIADTNKIAA